MFLDIFLFCKQFDPMGTACLKLWHAENAFSKKNTQNRLIQFLITNLSLTNGWKFSLNWSFSIIETSSWWRSFNMNGWWTFLELFSSKTRFSSKNFGKLSFSFYIVSKIYLSKHFNVSQYSGIASKFCL